jgi:SAM-dependent methyltransferase
VKRKIMQKKDTFTDTEVAHYEKNRYRGLDQRMVHHREKRILERIFDGMGKKSGLALDIPCGYGRFTPLLHRQGFIPVSSDYSFSMVKRALKSYPDMPLHGGFIADAKNLLPLKDGTAEVILSMRFFHHIHNERERGAVLSEFSRVTRKWVVLSFYQSTPIHLLQRLLRRIFKRARRKIKMIDQREFEQALEGTSLRIEKIYPLFRGIHAQRIALLRNESAGLP